MQNNCPHCHCHSHTALTRCQRGQNEARQYVRSFQILFHLIHTGDILFATLDGMPQTVIFEWIKGDIQQRPDTFLRLVQRHLTGFMYGNAAYQLQQIMRSLDNLWDTDLPIDVMPLRVVRIPHAFFLHFEEQVMINSRIRLSPDGTHLRYRESPTDERYLTVRHANLMYRDAPADERPPPIDNPVFWESPVPILDDFLPFSSVRVSCDPTETKDTQDPCCICLHQATYIDTQCHHSFCSCVLTHLQKNRACPLCRTDITALSIQDRRVFDTMQAMHSNNNSSFTFA